MIPTTILSDDTSLGSTPSKTKKQLLETGYQLLANKGFTAGGIKQILDTAGIPKGSFYHYFPSKELYGQAVLEAYFSAYLEAQKLRFNDSHTPAAERLLGYWQQWLIGNSGACHEQKCLVVKLSAEVADLSEAMRVTLRDGTDQVIKQLADCIRAGQVDGSLSVSDADATAVMLYQLWLGASLLAKLHRTSVPMEQAMQITRTVLLH